jgi:uncharacterized repeat protein (TIGR02543 family)
VLVIALSGFTNPALAADMSVLTPSQEQVVDTSVTSSDTTSSSTSASSDSASSVDAGNHASVSTLSSTSSTSSDAEAECASTADSGNQAHNAASAQQTYAVQSDFAVSTDEGQATVANNALTTVGTQATRDDTAGNRSTTDNKAASKTYAVTFDENGGSVSAPIVQSNLLEGKVISLPNYEGTKSGYQFAGWSTDSDAAGAGSSHYTNAVYAVGSSYTVTDEDVVLYAVWVSDAPATANFFIRYDGAILTEPQSHSASQYSSGICIKDAIPHAMFHADSTVGVGEYLKNMPTDEQIAAVCSQYDPLTQYVMWYVIKHEGGSWHVDGVLLDKSKVNLCYSANAATGVWSNIPDGKQYSVGTKVAVTTNKPTRNDGYAFTGWNTKADGTGTSYANGALITMNQSLTLYAQWKNEHEPTTVPGTNPGSNPGTGSGANQKVPTNTPHANADSSIAGRSSAQSQTIKNASFDLLTTHMSVAPLEHLALLGAALTSLATSAHESFDGSSADSAAMPSVEHAFAGSSQSVVPQEQADEDDHAFDVASSSGGINPVIASAMRNYILLGMCITFIYGLSVLLRRCAFTHKLTMRENTILSGDSANQRTRRKR